jgi:methylenetetrahydrofolate dehydrogenase (NADP+)/methenyltetrahydrofolate cyclohydrolase
LDLLEHAGASLRGAHAVVVGRSNLFGKPMGQLLLLAADATVTMCHSRTAELPAICRRADILIAAVGRSAMVGADGLVGDVDFAAVAPIARAITPLPGGVGPMTIACLLRNTVQAARCYP